MRKAIIYLLLIFVSVLYVGPFLWMVTTSFKTTVEAVADPPVLVPLNSTDTEGLVKRGIDPKAPALVKRAKIIKDNYYNKVMLDPHFDFALYTRNTLIIALLVTVGSMFGSSLVAYSLAKVRWRGRGIMLTLVLATMMVPGSVLMIPQYVIFSHFPLYDFQTGHWSLGWPGTNLPLWVPAFFGSSFFIFLLRQFYLTIPEELSDAARIDGCSELRIWWQIILPLSRPALAVVGLFAFMGAWRDFMGPLIYLPDERTFTLSLALLSFQSKSGGTPWELLMAATILTILPILALFFMARKTFIQGIATTGMKG